MPVTVKSFAKINHGLLIGPPGTRSDGFHDLRTIYQTIALHDVVKVSAKPAADGIVIRCKDARVPTDSTNTCWKIVERALQALNVRARVTIEIEKRLPVQGGMGAASSNAVAALLGLEKAIKKRLDPKDRLRIASEVGSDVPLFLIGGTVLGIGRGEQVFPLPDLPDFNLVVATPAVGVSTSKAFAAWDELFSAAESRARLRPDQPTLAKPPEPVKELTVSGQSDRLNMFSHDVYAWLGRVQFPAVVSGVSAKRGNRAEALLLDLVRTGIENDFERVVFPQFPELRDVKLAIERQGASYASISGSGSTVYGIFPNKAAAEKAARRLNAECISAQATITLNRAGYWKKMY